MVVERWLSIVYFYFMFQFTGILGRRIKNLSNHNLIAVWLYLHSIFFQLITQGISNGYAYLCDLLSTMVHLFCVDVYITIMALKFKF